MRCRSTTTWSRRSAETRRCSSTWTTIESTKEHPNENYARELMELFTLGVGNYTEQDVRESARAFTGWRITPPSRTPANKEQDTRPTADTRSSSSIRASTTPGQKTFLGKTGNFDGDDIVDIIMQQPAAGRFITRGCSPSSRTSTRSDRDDRPARRGLEQLEPRHQGDRPGDPGERRVLLGGGRTGRSSAVRSSSWSTRCAASSSSPTCAGQRRRQDRPGHGPDPLRATERGRLAGRRRVALVEHVLRARELPRPVPVRPGKDVRPAASRRSRRLTTAEDDGRPALGDLRRRQRAATARARRSSTTRGHIANPAERAATVAYLVLGSPEYQLI